MDRMPVFFGGREDKKKKNQKNDDAALLYLAKDISEQTYHEEEKRRTSVVGNGIEPPQKKNSMKHLKEHGKERSFKGKDILGGDVLPGTQLDEYGIPLIQESEAKKKTQVDPKKHRVPQQSPPPNQHSTTRQQHHHQQHHHPQQQQQQYPPQQQQQQQQYPPQQQQQQQPQHQGYSNPAGYQPGFYPNFTPAYQQYPPYPTNYPYPTSPIPQQERQHRPPATEKGDKGLDDPDVKAFMEKRRLKQQQQKELQLQKEMIEEARRLHISPEILAADAARRSPVPGSHPDSTKSRATPTHHPVQPETVPENHHYYQKKDYSDLNHFQFPNFSPILSPMNHHHTSEDLSNILHPTNLVAFKAASALIQIAKKHPNVNHLPQESVNIAATQLAGMWVNQVAFHLSKLPPSTPPAQSSSQPTSSHTASNEVTPRHGTVRPLQRKLSSKQSFRKEVIASMSAVLGERILRVASSADGETPRSNANYYANVHHPKSRSGDSHDSKTTWECKTCTLLNKMSYLTCEACGTTKEA